MDKLSVILEGWQNFMNEPEVPSEITTERSKECIKCPKKSKALLLTFVKDKLKEIEGYKCDICNCPLSAKLRSQSKCEKWQR